MARCFFLLEIDRAIHNTSSATRGMDEESELFLTTETRTTDERTRDDKSIIQIVWGLLMCVKKVLGNL